MPLSLCSPGQHSNHSHLGGPPLNSFQFIHVYFLLGDPEMDAVLQGQPHKCLVERDNHVPPHHTSGNIAQDAVGHCLRCQDTLLTHVQFVVCQTPQVLSCTAAPQPVSPQPVLSQGGGSFQAQDSAFVLAEFQSSCCPIPPAYFHPLMTALLFSILTWPPSLVSSANFKSQL